MSWPLDPERYRGTLHRLSGPAYRRYATICPSGAAVGPGPALAGWVTDVLLGVLHDPSAALGFLEAAHRELEGTGQSEANWPRGAHPVLTVASGRYVRLSGLGWAYDAESGELVTDRDVLNEILETTLHTDVYSLRVLFRAQAERCTTPLPPASGATPKA